MTAPTDHLQNRYDLAIENVYIAGHELHLGPVSEETIDRKLEWLAARVAEAQELRAKIAKREARKARAAA